jgi:hypothetical protein
MLHDAMQLHQYSVGFPNYPWLNPIKPFAGWNKDNPTSSLAWYEAYNAVKHNREERFEHATLFHAFEAVAACAVMLASQFGIHFDAWVRSDSSLFFSFDQTPKWTLADVYTFPYDDFWSNGREERWTPVKYRFG